VPYGWCKTQTFSTTHLFLRHIWQDSLDKCSARLRASASHNKTYADKAQTSMPEAEFEPAISTTRRPRHSSQSTRPPGAYKHDLHGLLKLLTLVFISDAIFAHSCSTKHSDHFMQLILLWCPGHTCLPDR